MDQSDEAGLGGSDASEPRPLEYRSQSRMGRAELSMARQVGLGFATWGAMLLFLVVMFFLSISSPETPAHPAGFVVMGIIAFIVLCIRVRVKYKWRGFIPGVLLGFGVTFALPLFLLAMMS